VGLYAYGVMSNHVHAVLYVDPDTATRWSDTEVAERWVRLFPAQLNGAVDPEACRLGAATTQVLQPVAGSAAAPYMPLGLVEYLALADWTGRIVRPDKRGAIANTAPPILGRLGLRPRGWQAQVLGTESRYWRAIGSAELLIEKAKAIGQCWLKGGGASRQRRALAAR
jgi:hypothetical protein